jgi:hypothetical protein
VATFLAFDGAEWRATGHYSYTMNANLPGMPALVPKRRTDLKAPVRCADLGTLPSHILRDLFSLTSLRCRASAEPPRSRQGWSGMTAVSRPQLAAKE